MTNEFVDISNLKDYSTNLGDGSVYGVYPSRESLY